jgi:hypothetical protein
MGELLDAWWPDPPHKCPRCRKEMVLITAVGDPGFPRDLDLDVDDVLIHELSPDEIEDFSREWFYCVNGCEFLEDAKWELLFRLSIAFGLEKYRNLTYPAKPEKVRIRLWVHPLPPDAFPKGYLHLYTHLLLAELVAFEKD